MPPLLPIFRYYVSDGLLALCGLAIVVLHFWTFLAFNSLAWWLLAVTFFAAAWAYCWNLQCISHNFIHNPFFTNAWLNRPFGCWRRWPSACRTSSIIITTSTTMPATTTPKDRTARRATGRRSIATARTTCPRRSGSIAC